MGDQELAQLRHQAGIHRRGRVGADDRGFSRLAQPEGDRRPAAGHRRRAPEQFGQAGLGCRRVLDQGLADGKLQQRGGRRVVVMLDGSRLGRPRSPHYRAPLPVGKHS